MKYRIQDIKKVLENRDFEVFVHGCNMHGPFDAGIAGLVKFAYPECFKVYREAVMNLEYNGGDIVPYEVEENKVILNAFTQIQPGRNGSYDLIDKAFYIISKVYDCKISFPLIGCGIAGLNWNVVSEIIDYRLNNKDYECIVRLEDVIKYKLLNKK